ncbi:hypothetical protein D9611_000841 [Ephemerocybe angulata]|uniref:Uncharacterized protein n=1 Tax=Ephemerocybe angulata TaxID=980116 RepID=A0A8H5BLZ3_9AGAR|nr:hypothetical protein D9611_000841 [Tulosesus angulatus]
MPGPSNAKRKKKANTKAKGKKRTDGDATPSKPVILSGTLSPEPSRRRTSPAPALTAATRSTLAKQPAGPRSRPPISHPSGSSTSHDDSDSVSYPPSPLLTPPPAVNLLDFQYSECSSVYESYHTKHASKERIVPEECIYEIEQVLNKPPFIHDPGNGPRVRDAKEFLKSEFFAQPPAFDDPLCAEFAQPEVLQMLQTVLPEEAAMILWYNKSRATGRVCPACQRLYRLGDTLPEHDMGTGEPPREPRPELPQLKLEQQISGLCSPVCFVLASFAFPGAIKGAWGKMAEDIDDTAWELLNAPDTAQTRNQSDTSAALGMVVRMTRLHDLGLGQLCFSPEEAEALENEARAPSPEYLPS